MQVTSKILIIDDEPVNLKLMARMLEGAGYEVQPLEVSFRAVEAAHALQPDLILLDINMPGMNGFQVCDALKRDHLLRDIPVIFLSVHDHISDKVTGFKVGGIDYITKPFQVKEVLARVATHLELRARYLEIERLRARERTYFEQINQLKDELLSTASHDIKSPISAILTSVYVLRHSGLLDNKREEDLNRIERETRKIHALVTDLLDFARDESGLNGHKQRVDLIDFLRTHLHDASFEADRKQIDLYLTATDQVLMVSLLPTRFSQAIQNLLSNAIKYTPPGGEVEVSVVDGGDRVTIQVSDNGIGIPTEDLPHIFEKFFRVQQPEHLKEQGSGLGMAIVQSVVAQHDGEIYVESEPGKGSTFRIILPV